MKECGIQWSQTWLHCRTLERAQNSFICPCVCKSFWFLAKLAGLHGSHASHSYGNQPQILDRPISLVKGTFSGL